MTMYLLNPPKHLREWRDNQRKRKDKQREKTDFESQLMRNPPKDGTLQEALGYDDFEYARACNRYYGNPIDEICQVYLSYFKKEVLHITDTYMGLWIEGEDLSWHPNDSAWNDWKNRDNIPDETVDLLKKIDSELFVCLPLEPVADDLDLNDKEFLRLVVKCMGDLPLLVEDYESIEW